MRSRRKATQAGMLQRTNSHSGISMIVLMFTAPSYTDDSATTKAMPAAQTSSSFASQSGQHLLIMAVLPENNADSHHNEVEKFGVHAVLPAGKTFGSLADCFAVLFGKKSNGVKQVFRHAGMLFACSFQSLFDDLKKLNLRTVLLR